jgi:hypothetical protein
MYAPDWHTTVLPELEKRRKSAITNIADTKGLGPVETEYLRGYLQALRDIERLGTPPKPDPYKKGV